MKWIRATDVKTYPSYSAGKSVLHLELETNNDKVDEALKLLKEGSFEIILQKRKKKRTLSANAYMWVLCEKIAEKIDSTKEDVYKQAIRRVGVSDTFTIPSKAVERQQQAWGSNGIGWFIDILHDDGITADVCYYYGSSSYTGSEMARLIDWIIDEANELSIETLTQEQKALLIDDWGNDK